MRRHNHRTWLVFVAVMLLWHATPVFGIRADATPVQQAELTASDGASADAFGNSVSVSGSTAVVGAPYRNGNTGAVYVFVRSGETWVQQAELTATDGTSGDGFGTSVAISRSTIVVGAPGKNVSTGVAYVFVGSGATWSQQAELIPSHIAADFGVSVAVSGSTVVVGTPYAGVPGSAFVFVRSGMAWSQRAELTAPSGGTIGDHFGASVAISGPITVVGADGEKSETGAAYLFVRSGGIWSQPSKITASDAASHDFFGASVGISGSTVLVGAHGKNSSTGATYVFVRSGGTWSQQAELFASDGVPNDNFGISVAISGSTAVAGADTKNANVGAAYLFVRSGTIWSQVSELTASDGTSGDFFGDAVAIYGSSELVGAAGRESATGAAYVFH